MDRRGYLRWLGVTGTGSLAGCSSLGGESEQPAGEFGLRPSDHLAIAVGNLNVVGLAVRELQETDDLRTATFDQTGPRERLAVAREAIAAAEGPSADVEPADVTAVATYETMLGATVDAILDLLQASRALERAKGRLRETEKEVAAAREPLERATATSASAVEHRDRAVAASNSVDGDRLTALDAEFGAVRDGLQALSGYVAGVDGLSRGYSRYLDGVETVQRADDAVADSSVGEASDAFERAAGSFEAAETRFAETLPGVPDPVAAELAVGRERSLVLGRLSTGYVSLLDGRSKLDAAAAAYERRELDTARQAVLDSQQAARRASDSFAAAIGVLEAGQEAAPDAFAADFERALCRADHLSTAAGHLETAVAAAGDGDRDRARTEAADAEAARDRIDRC